MCGWVRDGCGRGRNEFAVRVQNLSRDTSAINLDLVAIIPVYSSQYCTQSVLYSTLGIEAMNCSYFYRSIYIYVNTLPSHL